MLNRPTDAVQHLAHGSGLSESTGNLLLFSSPYPQPESGVSVRYTLYVNLAIVNILRVSMVYKNLLIIQG